MRYLVAEEKFPIDDLYLFEIDERFRTLKNFQFWDFNDSMNIKEELIGTFDILICDPPFLNKGFYTKMSVLSYCGMRL